MQRSNDDVEKNESKIFVDEHVIQNWQEKEDEKQIKVGLLRSVGIEISRGKNDD